MGYLLAGPIRSSDIPMHDRHRLAGNMYTGYQPGIRGLLNGYQEKIDQIPIKYLTDFRRYQKISAGYTLMSQITVDCGQRVINLN